MKQATPHRFRSADEFLSYHQVRSDGHKRRPRRASLYLLKGIDPACGTSKPSPQRIPHLYQKNPAESAPYQEIAALLQSNATAHCTCDGPTYT